MLVKELAEELDVTPQCIYNHIHKCKPQIDQFTYKVGRTTHLQDEAIYLIKDSLGLNQLKAVENKLTPGETIEIITNTINKNNLEMMNDFKNEINSYIIQENKELKSEIQDLKTTIRGLTESINEVKEEQSKTFIDKLLKNKLER